ncbi:MAG TPA: hypothetical protein VEB20_03640 [Azospirillaceae bacterium]|nr:hypothetical protein [Azospirillaceae bacterium]
MMINIALTVLMIASIIQAGLSIRRMGDDRDSRTRRLMRLEEENGRLEAGCDAMKEMVDKAAAQLREIEEATAELKAVRDEVDLELKRLAEAPRQRLFVHDKAALAHGKLWEVQIANDGFLRQIPTTPPAEEWAIGRTCLIGAATDRDARQRADARFPASLGFRILKVDRFRRA